MTSLPPAAPAAPLLGEDVLEALCNTGLHYRTCDEPNPADCAGCVRTRENAKYALAALEPLVAALVAERERAAEARRLRLIAEGPHPVTREFLLGMADEWDRQIRKSRR